MQTIKLSDAILGYIETIINVAKLANVDNIILEEGRVRAVDEDCTVFILQTDKVPALPFGAIGLNRINVFTSRYDIAKPSKGFVVESTVDDTIKNEPSFVRSLQFKGAGVKIDYRCANPKLIRAPKEIKDPITHSVRMSSEAIHMLSKGQAAMAADDVAFTGSKTGVTLEIKDNNSDALEYKFCDTVGLVGTTTVPDFHHLYPLKTITTLLKQNPDVTVFITAKGMMHIDVNGINVVVMPRSN